MSNTQSNITTEIKNNFLGIKPGNIFTWYDAIADIHNYHEFISSFPIPADYLSPDSIKEDRDAEEALRYGIDLDTLDNEEWSIENDERYINLNMDIDYEPDEFITENQLTSESESDGEWIETKYYSYTTVTQKNLIL